MTDITAFLTARLDEDEAAARAATPGPWRWGDWSSNFGTLEQERNTLERAPGYGSFPVVRHRGDDADEVLRLMDPLEIGGDDYPSNGEHIARHDPARVLAEVKAKRAILAEHAIVHRNIGWLEDGEEEGDEIPVCGRCVPKHSHFLSRAKVPAGPCRTVRLLAAPYAAHPDYNPAWRVE